MLYKTGGVVFRLTPYGETSAIVNVFTELFGLQAYIVNGLRSKSPKTRIAIYQPLTLLDMVVYHRENARIMRIKEARCSYVYQGLSSDLRKPSVMLFLHEVLNKVVREQSNAAELYGFIHVSLSTLDELMENVENFHLIFLIKLARFLGIGPYTVSDFFGERTTSPPGNERAMGALLQAEYTTAIRLSAAERKSILQTLLEFYTRHIDAMKSIKCIPVLHEMLR